MSTSPAPAYPPQRSGALGPAVAGVLIAGVMLVGTTGREVWAAWLDAYPAVATWISVFVATSLQAFPFLTLGVLLSAVVAVLMPTELLRRFLPRRDATAVPVAGLAGTLLPGCECASVPIAGALVARGVPAAAALTFLLAAPAINPVVLASTAVAFGGDLRVVLARFLASLLTSVTMGWWWLHRGRDDMIRVPDHIAHPHGSARERFSASVVHDLLHAGGYLVLGAALAATINVVVPRSVLDTLAGNVIVAVLTLATFAVVVAVCSEADAFVAASLTAFPMTARLAFMVVGPAVDVKLIAMQWGTFGRDFTRRFAPMTLLVAVLSSLVLGEVLL